MYSFVSSGRQRNIAECGINNMGSSLSSATSSSPATVRSKAIQTKDSELVTINEKVNLTKEQNKVLQAICNSYEMPISEYLQQALVEAMRFDIEEGNFSDALLEKLGLGTEKRKTDFTQPSTLKDELDKLRTRHKPQVT
jgi:hypothetical protein